MHDNQILRQDIDPKNNTLDRSDILAYIKDILVEKFGSGSKTIVEEFDDRWNFACPFCGDSSTDGRKKRGNMDFSDYHYHCYNCGEHHNLLWFLKKLDRDVKTGSVNNFVESAKNKNGISGVFSKSNDRIAEIFGEDILDHAIDRDLLINRLSLVEAYSNKRALDYLHGRCQYDMKKFAWDPKKNKLYIFNLDNTGTKVLGYQIRSFWNKGPKYLTYEMSTMYKELGLDIDSEIAKRLDPLSTAFGCLQLDFSSVITIFEGPLDSFLMPNSMALCSLSRRPPFITKYTRFMFDFDKSAKIKSSEYLHEGLCVFMWKKFLNENIPDYRSRSKVDFTDVNIYAKEHNLKFDYDSYFTDVRLKEIWI